MIRPIFILWLSSLAWLAAANRPDLLRFTNGDQLHGTFLGIKPGPQAVWQRDDVATPVEFKTERIRHVVLRGGRPLHALETLSQIELINGDRIPGAITAIDDEHVTLETAFAGVLRIPRRMVSMLAPNPLGGRVYYHGPFSEDDWKMTHAGFPDGFPAAADDATDKEAAAEDKEADQGDEPPGRWAFSGSAWYWQNKSPGTALVRENGMPDRAVLSFDLAWKSRLNLAIGFHSDFTPAKAKDDDKNKDRKARIVHAFAPGDSSNLPRVFGNSYVLQMVSNYLMLFRTFVDEDGNTSVERVQTQNNSLRLGDAGNAKVEIRSNRGSGGISLFVNDEFVGQWSEMDLAARGDGKPSGKGSGFGFVVQGSDSPVRISDIVVSEWNGMPDSARSLQVDDQDVVLMANGTDRYAGKVGRLGADGKILFEGKHGSFRFPLDDVAELRFARDQLATPEDPPADNIVVRLYPVGTVSGRPATGDGSTLGLVSPVAGEMNLSLDSAVMLEFNASNQFIDAWDADF